MASGLSYGAYGCEVAFEFFGKYVNPWCPLPLIYTIAEQLDISASQWESVTMLCRAGV